MKFTGFHTFCGSFSYKRMRQGLCGAAFSCQRLLNLVLRSMHRYIGCLIDDILVFSMDFNTHLKYHICARSLGTPSVGGAHSEH